MPVLAFETETDLIAGKYVADRQRDNTWFRDWEVAGTSHADDYTTFIGMADNGRSNVAGAIVTQDNPLTIIGCTAKPNSGPQHWVLDAAISSWPPAPVLCAFSGKFLGDLLTDSFFLSLLARD